MIVPLFSSKNPRLGVDISSTAVKVLMLEKYRNSFRPVGFAIEPISPGAVQDKTITDTDAVAGALSRALSRSRAKTKHVVMAVPTSACVSRVLNISNPGNEFELEEQVRMESDQYIPFPIEEVSLDFEPLHPEAGTKQKKQSTNDDSSILVIMAATRSTNVEARVAVAEAAGLSVDVMDIESFAIQNTFTEIIASTLTPEDRAQPIALLDVGANTTTINVFSGNDIIYSKEHPFGGKQLTNEISLYYGLSPEEAEEKKRNDTLPDDYHRKVLQPFIDNMAMQVGRFIQYFYSETNRGTIGLILLGGGTANTPGVIERINNETGIQTRGANPFIAIGQGSTISAELLANHGSSMLVACGLALRSFDR
ncbi:type IV pilus assembly protein PilM [Halothiobacillus sp.]|uniref:type IV pilus assembly protein PilM n=1 Tax=Halothiobacillus sp. TaxID=1891311 RepID=UPI0026075167|nr:type IV pilus assembly protein PilM [Halothiobacillus sp.]